MSVCPRILTVAKHSKHIHFVIRCNCQNLPYLLSCKPLPTLYLCSRLSIPTLCLSISNIFPFGPPTPEDPFEFWPCSPACLHAPQHDTAITFGKYYLCCTYKAINDKTDWPGRQPAAPSSLSSRLTQTSKGCSVNRFFHGAVHPCSTSFT